MSRAASSPNKSTPAIRAAVRVLALRNHVSFSKLTSRTTDPFAGSPEPTRFSTTAISFTVPMAGHVSGISWATSPVANGSGMRWTPAVPLISMSAPSCFACPSSATRAASRTTSAPSGPNRSGNPFAQTPAAAPEGIA